MTVGPSRGWHRLAVWWRALCVCGTLMGIGAGAMEAQDDTLLVQAVVRILVQTATQKPPDGGGGFRLSFMHMVWIGTGLLVLAVVLLKVTGVGGSKA